MNPAGDPRRVPPLGAFLEGWRRVWRAPALVFGATLLFWSSLHLLSAALAAPTVVAVVVTPSLPFVSPWFDAFYLQLRNLSDVLAPEFAPFFQPAGVPTPVSAALAIHVVLWMFLAGGALDRLARGRAIGTAAFFAACGVYFVRFFRLIAILALPAYALFRLERAFETNLAAQLAILVLVAIAGIVVDFAKVRAVVEDRHSMIAALTGAARFIRRRFWRVLMLSLLNGLAMLAVVRVAVQIASTIAVPSLMLLMSAGLMLVATFARLAMLAAEVVFFQGELAHAGYTASAVPVWPDSPAIEAIENLRQRTKDRAFNP